MAVYEDIVEYNRTQVRCNLCNVFVQDNDHNIEVHINGERHDDLYYRRLKIRNNIIFQEHLYCLLCEVRIEPVFPGDNLNAVKRHIQQTHHNYNMDRINELIVGEFVDLPDNINDRVSSVHCTICNCYVAFKYDVIDQHIGRRRHRRGRSIAVQPLNGIFAIEGTDDELWCKICDVNIENYIDTILEHVDSDDEHSDKLNEIEELIEDEDISIDEFLENVNEYKAYCNECGVWVPCNPYNLQQHIGGERHTR